MIPIADFISFHRFTQVPFEPLSDSGENVFRTLNWIAYSFGGDARGVDMDDRLCGMLSCKLFPPSERKSSLFDITVTRWVGKLLFLSSFIFFERQDNPGTEESDLIPSEDQSLESRFSILSRACKNWIYIYSSLCCLNNVQSDLFVSDLADLYICLSKSDSQVF